MAVFGEIIVAILVLGALWWYFVKNDRRTIMLQNVPGPIRDPIFGCALDFKSAKDFIPVLTGYLRDYGDIIKVRLGPCFYYIFSVDSDLMEELLSSNSLLDKSEQYSFFHDWLGMGLLTSTGRRWKSHRKIITPAFHFQILEKFITLFQNPTLVFIEKLLKHDGKEKFDVYKYINLYSLDIICETAMGTSVNAQRNEDSEYVEAIREMGRIVMDRCFSAIKMHNFLYKFTPTYQKEKKYLKTIHDYSISIIQRRKQELEKALRDDSVDSFLEKQEKLTFLDILLTAKNQDGTSSLTDTDIREEVDTFMFEGHDTVSSAIAFALYLLSNHPEVQDLIIQEQKDLFGDEQNPSITYSDLQNMSYLQLVIKETLRLYPSVPLFGRNLKEDFKYKNYVFPQGTTMIVYTYEIHRSPKYFPDPEKFMPERFAGINKDPFSYVPFSAGPRNCIGQRFAMLEMKYILSAVLRNFNLLPSHEEPILLAETILKTENGVKIRLEKRIY